MSSTVYPVKYIETVTLTNGTSIQLRPIHKADRLHVPIATKQVSKKSLYQRFLGYPSINSRMIKKFTELDYDEDMAIVAEISDDKGEKQLIGVARLASYNKSVAEFAIIIIDKWHGKGLGKILTKTILDIARDLGYKKIKASLFAKNFPIKHLLSIHGFTFENSTYGILNAELNL